jgi:hypothetical protein
MVPSGSVSAPYNMKLNLFSLITYISLPLSLIISYWTAMRHAVLPNTTLCLTKMLGGFNGNIFSWFRCHPCRIFSFHITISCSLIVCVHSVVSNFLILIACILGLLQTLLFVKLYYIVMLAIMKWNSAELL